MHSYTWAFWVKPTVRLTCLANSSNTESQGTLDTWGSVLHRGGYNVERVVGVWMFPGHNNVR